MLSHIGQLLKTWYTFKSILTAQLEYLTVPLDHIFLLYQEETISIYKWADEQFSGWKISNYQPL